MTNQDILHTHIREAKKGNQTAYNYLLNTFWNDIHRFLLSKTNDENEAEDITVITFSKAFDKLDLYDNQYKFKSWLLTIAKNLLIDEQRKKKNSTVSIHQQKEEIYSLKDHAPSPEDKIIIEQNLAALKRNIRELKPKYQEMIHLRYFQELSYKEIAQQNGESINNVKVKLLRAKKLLAEIITQNKQ